MGSHPCALISFALGNVKTIVISAHLASKSYQNGSFLSLLSNCLYSCKTCKANCNSLQHWQHRKVLIWPGRVAEPEYPFEPPKCSCSGICRVYLHSSRPQITQMLSDIETNPSHLCRGLVGDSPNWSELPSKLYYLSSPEEPRAAQSSAGGGCPVSMVWFAAFPEHNQALRARCCSWCPQGPQRGRGADSRAVPGPAGAPALSALLGYTSDAPFPQKHILNPDGKWNASTEKCFMHCLPESSQNKGCYLSITCLLQIPLISGCGRECLKG